MQIAIKRGTETLVILDGIDCTIQISDTPAPKPKQKWPRIFKHAQGSFGDATKQVEVMEDGKVYSWDGRTLTYLPHWTASECDKQATRGNWVEVPNNQ
jgi:hypothetical protein